MLRWMDGLEHYGLSEAAMLEGVGGAAAWSQVTSEFALSTTNPATGTYHIRMDSGGASGGSHLRRAFGQSTQVAGFGYRFSLDDLPATEDVNDLDANLQMANFRDVSNNLQCRFQMGTEGSISAYRSDTFLNRSDPVVAPGGYHHFECKVNIANSGGYMEARINEVTVLNLTGIDTQTTGNAETSQVVIREGGALTDTAQFGFMDIDDVFAWDDDASDAENTVVDWVGDKGVYYLPVNADTAEADWTLSSGVTGYSLLDELDPNDADYIGDSTGAARSIFGVAALPGNVAEVIAMQPVGRFRKEESGSVTIRMGVVVNASESYTADFSPSTTFAYGTPTPKTIDPDTGVAWANTANPDLLIERTV